VINKSLNQVTGIMKDGVSRSPETIFSMLSMMGSHYFNSPIDIYWLCHLASLERDPKNIKLLRLKQ
jgi:hypothetical protein